MKEDYDTFMDETALYWICTFKIYLPLEVVEQIMANMACMSLDMWISPTVCLDGWLEERMISADFKVPYREMVCIRRF